MTVSCVPNLYPISGALTGLLSGRSLTLQDNGANSIIVVQGEGRINKLKLSSPKMIGFHDLTEDEVFVTEPAAKAGVVYENTSATEPLVVLRYFGPDVNPYSYGLMESCDGSVAAIFGSAL